MKTKQTIFERAHELFTTATSDHGAYVIYGRSTDHHMASAREWMKLLREDPASEISAANVIGECKNAYKFSGKESEDRQ